MNYFLTCAAIAGLAIIWRNWLIDHKQFSSFLKKIPFLGKALTCGSCFTYWISLLALTIYNPIKDWPILSYNNVYINFLFTLLFQWMAISFGAVFLRFIYVLIQELVNYLTHGVNQNHKH